MYGHDVLEIDFDHCLEYVQSSCWHQWHG